MAIRMMTSESTTDIEQALAWASEGRDVVDEHGSEPTRERYEREVAWYNERKERGENVRGFVMSYHVMATTYRGRVLELREYNGYDDSDFYALVWDGDADGEVKRVEYATTRGWSYINGARVDATPEVVGWYADSKARRYLESWKSQQLTRAMEPQKGDTVTVTGGRKLPKGTTGTIAWIGQNDYASQYATSTERLRVGLKVDGQDKLVYVCGSQVVVDPQTVMDRTRPFSEGEVAAAHEAERVRRAYAAA